MNKEKNKIIIGILQNDSRMMSNDVIDKYLFKCPGDTDMLIMKAYLYLLNDKVKDGISLLKFVIRKCPFSVDALFLLGQAYNEQGEFYDALLCLGKADNLFVFLYGKYKRMDMYLLYDYNISKELTEEIIRQILTKIKESKDNKLKEMLFDYKERLEKYFDFFDDIIRNKEDVIGKYFSNNIDDKRFFGIYSPFDLSFYLGDEKKNLHLYTGEMLKKYDSGTEIKIKLSQTSLVPVLAFENISVIKVKQNDERVITIPINESLHFNYFKMCKGEIEINADKPIMVAEPVQLVHHKQNKKLVISLFVDGLSQEIIAQYGLENIMPYTYEFFKKGMICKNAFTSSDWTYPSLASLISGLSVSEHMMIHPDVNVKFPKEQKLLFEYFKEAGYHTTVISGDWRTTCATYDSIRGVDRYIAKHQNCGFRTEDVIVDVIDHLQTFKNTDQYIWIGTGDLHDVADGHNMPTAIQADMDLNEFEVGEKSLTSVKQSYNINKINKYIRVAKHIDSKLHVLYDYIEENFSDSEFVITLFGDHGQAYIVKPDQHHLSRGLSNIGFMTRGGEISGVNEEYINIVDYNNIITKLAGLKNINIESDGILPKSYGGNIESKFAVTETIHPGDPYMIAIHSPKYNFYMTTEGKVTHYGKIDLSSYSVELRDENGNEVQNGQIKDEFISFVLERTKYIRIY